MFRQLRNRFLFSNMLLTWAVLFGAFALLFSLVYGNVRHDAQARLLALPDAARGEVSPVPAAGSVVYYITDITVSGEPLGSAVFFRITVTGEGEISREDPEAPELEEAYRNMVRSAWEHQNIHRVISGGSAKWQSVIVPSAETEGAYDIYFMDVTSGQALLSRLLQAFLLIAPATLLAVFLISRKAADRAVRPIAEAWEKQRQFVADASHELKTPLAVIRANTDALSLAAGDSPESREKWIGYIRDEVDRMSGLVNELLSLARMESGGQSEPHEVFDLGECIGETCIAAEARIYEKQIRLEESIGENILIKSSRAHIKQLVSILLDNAVKYTDAGGFIRVSLKKQKGAAVLSVENSGAGIPASMLPYIFDRFYRADRARQNEDGSYGLGLSIAKSISERFGAELTVRSIPAQSTTFTFRIKTAG